MERLFAILKDIIYNITGKNNLTPDTDFIKDLELTSLDIMNIICAIEDTFDISIPTRDVWTLHQVRDTLLYMKNIGAKAD